MNICPKCSNEVFDNSRFCHNCGASLTPSANVNLKSSDSERRIVTILFCDVKGSTSLAENMDPEEVLVIMNSAFRILIDPVVKYGGTVARLMGDAILAFFGAPQAHEDDADRACYAALEIINGSEEFAEKLAAERNIEGFKVRVGINTGLVVVGEVGTDSNVEYTAMGDAVNIAARMESLAEPGTILITEETNKHLHNQFGLTSLGKLNLKGKKELVETFRLTGPPGKSGKAGSNHFTGRQNEIGIILEAFQRLGNKNGGVISVYGDHGIGKTRFIHEVKKFMPPEIKWIYISSEAYNQNTCYWGIKTFLGNYLDISGDSSCNEVQKSLEKSTPDELLPVLLCLLNNKNSKADNNSDVAPELFKGQLVYALTEFLKSETLKQPAVIVWDNLHWCDSPSRDILKELVYLSHEHPFLIILLYRLDENETAVWNFHHTFIEYPGHENYIIRLNAFNSEESLQFIKSILNIDNVTADLSERIYERTQGNPQFIEEVLKSFDEKGLLKVCADGVEITDPGELLVPALLQNTLMSRLDCLDKNEKSILQIASVFGRIFREDLLVYALREEIIREDIINLLRNLQQKELILRHLSPAVNKAFSRREYIFKNPLMQEVVYGTLLHSHRQKLHKKIADLIELNAEEVNEHLCYLGSHYERAKDYSKSFGYYLKAGDRASGLFANEDASFFYEKALEQTKYFTPASEQLTGLHLSLADVYSFTAKYNAAVEHYNYCIQNKNSFINIPEIYRKIGLVYQHQGLYRKAHEYFDIVLDFTQNSEFDRAVAYLQKGMLYFRENNLQEAERFSYEALNILSRYENKHKLAEVYNNLGNILSRNNPELACRFYTESIEIRETLNDLPGLAASYNNYGMLCQEKNNFDLALEYYFKSRDICSRTGNNHGLARVYDNLCTLYSITGDSEKAMDYNLKAVSIIGRIAKESSQLNCDLWLQSDLW